MDAGEFRVPESTCKSDHDKYGVPKAEKVLAPCGDDPADVCRGQRSLGGSYEVIGLLDEVLEAG